MDPLDHRAPALGSTVCAACQGLVPAGSVHLLARRDDLAFVQVECPSCGSTTLAFGLASGLDARVGAPPVTTDDVLDMHRLLSRWPGGLRELLATKSSRPSAAS